MFRKQLLLTLSIVVLLSCKPAQINTWAFASSEKASLQELKASLAAKIQVILGNEALNGAVTGISIRSGVSGEILYSSFGDTRLHPASNMKILTAAAALETLGPDYQFSTEVRTDGIIKGNTLHGNLFLKGKGDPTLMQDDLVQFAKKLKAQGVKKISGDLISDDSWYDSVRLSQDLNWSDESNPTGAQISALTLSPDNDYDAGTVLLEVTPASKAGKKARSKLIPATNYVSVINKTQTVGPKESENIMIEREHGTNRIVVKGSIPLNGEASKSWVAIWEPAQYVLDVFKQSLMENGVRIGKKSEMKSGVTPENATLLVSKKSMPLKDLLLPFLKLSNNGLGEVLTKEMGKAFHNEGSWEKGLEVIHKSVIRFGVKGDTLLLRDGSGMSHKNMIPANELTQLLYSIQQKSWYPVFENALPIAGVTGRLTGGTMSSRLTEAPAKGNVKAKTGSITGVSTLSGYITTQSGERLIFAIMINNHLSPSVKTVEDTIVNQLCTL